MARRRQWGRRRNPFGWLSSRQRFAIVLLAILLIALQVLNLLNRNLRPSLEAIAAARAKVIATQAINDAINNRISQEIKYGLLITVHTDANGKPSWAQVNTMEVNRIVATTTLRVQESLAAIRGEVVRIPLGQAFHSELLSGVGPWIPFTIIPIGTVHVKVTDAFEQAGINQTRHKIYLEVNTEVRIVIPLVSSTVTVSSQVPIADVTYLGEVPDTVIDLPLPTAGLGGEADDATTVTGP